MTIEICGSRGPRIGGEDSAPRCARGYNHPGLHNGFEGSGYEHIQWGAPLYRDSDFVANWTGEAEI